MNYAIGVLKQKVDSISAEIKKVDDELSMCDFENGAAIEFLQNDKVNLVAAKKSLQKAIKKLIFE